MILQLTELEKDVPPICTQCWTSEKPHCHPKRKGGSWWTDDHLHSQSSGGSALAVFEGHSFFPCPDLGMQQDRAVEVYCVEVDWSTPEGLDVCLHQLGKRWRCFCLHFSSIRQEIFFLAEHKWLRKNVLYVYAVLNYYNDRNAKLFSAKSLPRGKVGPSNPNTSLCHYLETLLKH